MTLPSQQKIIRAAQQVFKEKGYLRADMRTIARRAGIAVGTIYNYYPNKGALYQAILHTEWAEIEEGLREIEKSNLPLLNKIEQVSTHLFRFVKEHDRLWREIVQDDNRSLKQFDEGMKAQEKAYTDLRNVMRSMFIRENFPENEVDRMVITFVATVTHLGHHFPEEAEENKEYVKKLFSVLLRR